MSARFEELAWSDTPMGEISLRRRVEPTLNVDVYEVKLGDEYLMSSLFTVAEIALATIGLAAVEGERLDVCNGGAGLGYTASAALEDPRVASLVVVDALAEVLSWHEKGLLPSSLNTDLRTRLVHGDFFALAASDGGLDPEQPGRRFDAILLDVDHTPQHVLHPSHAPFYSVPGLTALARFLKPGGVFALWSDDPPEPGFQATMAEVFPHTDAHLVEFANPLTGGTSSNSVYVGVLA